MLPLIPAAIWPAALGLPVGLLELGVGGALAVGLAAAGTAWMWPRRRTWEEWLDFRSAHRGSPQGNTHRLAGRVWSAPRAAVAVVLAKVVPRQVEAVLAAQLRCAAMESSAEEIIAGWLLVTAAVIVVASLLLAAGLIPGTLLAPLLIIPGLGGWVRVVRAGSRRRSAIVAQLPILVDLMSLEQSGGGIGSRRAMELVVSRLRGEAATVLRTCLAGSATAGTPPLDVQLEGAASDLQIPALAALAAVVRLQRQEGISAGAPLGRLARGLRDRQRDELTARGRRALVTMLLPIASCILLPFILIILYPALARLAGALS